MPPGPPTVPAIGEGFGAGSRGVFAAVAGWRALSLPIGRQAGLALSVALPPLIVPVIAFTVIYRGNRNNAPKTRQQRLYSCEVPKSGRKSYNVDGCDSWAISSAG